jgi:hypothetical protein
MYDSESERCITSLANHLTTSEIRESMRMLLLHSGQSRWALRTFHQTAESIMRTLSALNPSLGLSEFPWKYVLSRRKHMFQQAESTHRDLVQSSYAQSGTLSFVFRRHQRYAYTVHPKLSSRTLSNQNTIAHQILIEPQKTKFALITPVSVCCAVLAPVIPFFHRWVSIDSVPVVSSHLTSSPSPCYHRPLRLLILLTSQPLDSRPTSFGSRSWTTPRCRRWNTASIHLLSPLWLRSLRQRYSLR